VCLRTIGVDETSAGVAGLYSDFLDGWLVDEDDPMPGAARLEVVRRPLLMSSVDAAAEMAGAALDLGLRLRAERAPA
jgi:LPPG:FO 2-phospho-L-lactate transferase